MGKPGSSSSMLNPSHRPSSNKTSDLSTRERTTAFPTAGTHPLVVASNQRIRSASTNTSSSSLSQHMANTVLLDDKRVGTVDAPVGPLSSSSSKHAVKNHVPEKPVPIQTRTVSSSAEKQPPLHHSHDSSQALSSSVEKRTKPRVPSQHLVTPTPHKLEPHRPVPTFQDAIRQQQREGEEDNGTTNTGTRQSPPLEDRPSPRHASSSLSSAARLSRHSLPPLCARLHQRLVSLHQQQQQRDNKSKPSSQAVAKFAVNEECTSLKFSPSGRLVIGGFADGTVRLFDLTGTFQTSHHASQKKSSTTHNKTRGNSQSAGGVGGSSILVDSKDNQLYGAVAGQIHAKGVHTSLLMTVDIAPDCRWCFAGVLRGSMELLALDLTELEDHYWNTECHGRQEEQEEEEEPATNLLDHVTVYRHADAKLRGFGACTRLQHSPSYLLLTGKAIKNIHIWKFTPPPPRSSNDSGPALVPTWVQLYNTQTNGTTIQFLQFRRCPGTNNTTRLEALSKSDGQKLRVWDLTSEDLPVSTSSSKEGPPEPTTTTTKQPVRKRPAYTDVANTEAALAVAGNLSLCGGSEWYNQMSLVSLEDSYDGGGPRGDNNHNHHTKPVAWFHHSEMALPGIPSPSVAEPGGGRRRPGRGDLTCLDAAYTTGYDSNHVLLQLSNGSVWNYNPQQQHQGPHSSHHHNRKKDTTTTTPSSSSSSSTSQCTTLPHPAFGSLPAGVHRCLGVGRVGQPGLALAAAAIYSATRNKGRLVICPMDPPETIVPALVAATESLTREPSPTSFWGFWDPTEPATRCANAENSTDDEKLLQQGGSSDDTEEAVSNEGMVNQDRSVPPTPVIGINKVQPMVGTQGDPDSGSQSTSKLSRLSSSSSSTASSPELVPHHSHPSASMPSPCSHQPENSIPQDSPDSEPSTMDATSIPIAPDCSTPIDVSCSDLNSQKRDMQLDNDPLVPSIPKDSSDPLDGTFKDATPSHQSNLHNQAQPGSHEKLVPSPLDANNKRVILSELSRNIVFSQQQEHAIPGKRASPDSTPTLSHDNRRLKRQKSCPESVNDSSNRPLRLAVPTDETSSEVPVGATSCTTNTMNESKSPTAAEEHPSTQSLCISLEPLSNPGSSPPLTRPSEEHEAAKIMTLLAFDTSLKEPFNETTNSNSVTTETLLSQPPPNHGNKTLSRKEENDNLSQDIVRNDTLVEQEKGHEARCNLGVNTSAVGLGELAERGHARNVANKAEQRERTTSVNKDDGEAESLDTLMNSSYMSNNIQGRTEAIDAEAVQEDNGSSMQESWSPPVVPTCKSSERIRVTLKALDDRLLYNRLWLRQRKNSRTMHDKRPRRVTVTSRALVVQINQDSARARLCHQLWTMVETHLRLHKDRDVSRKSSNDTLSSWYAAAQSLLRWQALEQQDPTLLPSEWEGPSDHSELDCRLHYLSAQMCLQSP